MNLRQSQLLYCFLAGGANDVFGCTSAPFTCRRSFDEQISLESGAVWSLEPCRKQRLFCERGILWVTQTDDEKDYLLHAGESLTINEYSKVVVQALESAVFQRSDLPE